MLCVAAAITLSAVAPPVLAATSAAAAGNADHPGCEHVSVRDCVALAINAMGGDRKLAAINNEQLEIVGHRSLPEQSYRQAPFLTTYGRVHRVVDFRKGVVVDSRHGIWPESDVGTEQAESDSTIVASAKAAVVRGKHGDSPASHASIDRAREILALGPVRLLLTAEAAPHLHYMADETLRATPHTVVAFRWNGIPVKVLLNGFNHLPDAMEDTRTFDDFWFAWGDVTQRVYFSNWKLMQGIEYPTSRIEERNGIPWRSSQVLDAKFNVALKDQSFAMDPKAAAKSAESPGWNVPFSVTRHIALAPGVDLYRGSWSVTLIRQERGVLVLEAPISPFFAKGAFAKARAKYPTLPIKGVLTTSDSWPHIAGVREAVAEKLPVYALDLNESILKRLVSAPHVLRPDDQQTHPQPAHWVTVSSRMEIGSGPNRVVLIPLRGASTGRQYMVYFPAHKLLYASDTLVLESGSKLYDPELMREVVQAVERNHLQVDTVYAMHQDPVAWSKVTRLVSAALDDPALH
ncbi:MAG: hypothetical protein ACREPY_01850 [Rhodanobacteraceae bacterium]